MGEAKRRAGPDFVNVSGRHVTDLARGIMDLLERPFEQGLQADIAAHVLVATAVDLWRANYGDEQAAQALKVAIDRRLSKPLTHWGGTPSQEGPQ